MRRDMMKEMQQLAGITPSRLESGPSAGYDAPEFLLEGSPDAKRTQAGKLHKSVLKLMSDLMDFTDKGSAPGMGPINMTMGKLADLRDALEKMSKA